MVQNPPISWIEHCVQLDMFDTHLDAISCMQSGVSRGFNIETLRSLAQLYIEHGFLTHDEADIWHANCNKREHQHYIMQFYTSRFA